MRIGSPARVVSVNIPVYAVFGSEKCVLRLKTQIQYLSQTEHKHHLGAGPEWHGENFPTRTGFGHAKQILHHDCLLSAPVGSHHAALRHVSSFDPPYSLGCHHLLPHATQQRRIAVTARGTYSDRRGHAIVTGASMFGLASSRWRRSRNVAASRTAEEIDS